MAGTEPELGRRWPATPGLHRPDSGEKEHRLYTLKLSPLPNRPWRRRRTGPRGAPGGRAMAAAASSRSGENTPGIGQQTIDTPSTTFRPPPRQTKHHSEPRGLRAHRRPSSSALWRPERGRWWRAGGGGRRQGLGTVRIDQGEADDTAYARNRTGSERGRRILARTGRGARGDVLPVDDDETLLTQSYSNSYRLRIIHLMLACLLLEQALIDAWLGSNPCRQLRWTG